MASEWKKTRKGGKLMPDAVLPGRVPPSPARLKSISAEIRAIRQELLGATDTHVDAWHRETERTLGRRIVAAQNELQELVDELQEVREEVRDERRAWRADRKRRVRLLENEAKVARRGLCCVAAMDALVAKVGRVDGDLEMRNRMVELVDDVSGIFRHELARIERVKSDRDGEVMSACRRLSRRIGEACRWLGAAYAGSPVYRMAKSAQARGVKLDPAALADMAFGEAVCVDILREALAHVERRGGVKGAAAAKFCDLVTGSILPLRDWGHDRHGKAMAAVDRTLEPAAEAPVPTTQMDCIDLRRGAAR